MQKITTYVEENELGEVVIKQKYLDRLTALKKQKESVERELKTLSTSITNELKEKYTMTTKVGTYNFVVKGGFFDFVFDEESFKKDNLELYIKYLVPHQSTISYQLTSAERKKKDVQ